MDISIFIRRSGCQTYRYYGALASYVQQLVANNQPLPNKVYLLSPMLDATLTNPEITEDLSNKDRFVNKDGLQRIFNVWTQGEALANPLISPIYGQYTIYHLSLYSVVAEKFIIQI